MDNTQARPLVVRRAAAADAAALARPREVMLSDMGMVAAGTDPGWRHKAWPSGSDLASILTPLITECTSTVGAVSRFRESRFHVLGVLSYRAYQAFLAGIWSCAVWPEGEF